MKESTAWPSILAMALLLSWVEPAPCAAQPPALPTATAIPAPCTQPVALPASTAPPAVDPVTSQGDRRLPPLPPSTVSPAIERFVRQSGRDLPPASPPSSAPAVNPETSQGGRPSPSPPPSPAPRHRSPGGPGRPGPAAGFADLAGGSAPPPVGSGPATTGPSSLAIGLTLKPAPLEPTDLRFPINLATALRLSDARPLIVAAAQASVWVAEARTHAGQAPLGPFGLVWRRLYPPRRRRPGLQQGHHDRAERELLLRRSQPVSVRQLDRCHLSSHWPRGRS